MNNKAKLIAGIAALALIIGGAAILYRVLGEDFGRPSNLGTFDSRGSKSQSVPESTLSGTTLIGNSGTSSNGSSETGSSQTLRPAPDFTMYDMQGEAVTLSSFRGRPVVINFWASWCPPCKEEMPYFETVYRELGDEVQFLMVDIVDGQRETVALGRQFIEDRGFTFPVYFDTDQEAAYEYSIASIPTTFFLDSEGHFIAYAEGMIDEAGLRQGIGMITN